MRKAERLFQLLTLLRSRRQVITAQELAERLEVSERTIYRDMQALSLQACPLSLKRVWVIALSLVLVFLL